MTKKKTILMIVAFGFGGWLVLDALFALFRGSYIGAGNPGLWADILREIGIDPFSFAPGVLSLGVLWLVSALYILLGFRKWRGFYAITAIMSLWYLPVGTFLSLSALSLILAGLLPRPHQRLFIAVVGVVAAFGVTFVLLQNLNIAGR